MHKNGTSVDLVRDADILHARAENMQPITLKRNPFQRNLECKFDNVLSCSVKDDEFSIKHNSDSDRYRCLKFPAKTLTMSNSRRVSNY